MKTTTRSYTKAYTEWDKWITRLEKTNCETTREAVKSIEDIIVTLNCGDDSILDSLHKLKIMGDKLNAKMINDTL